MRKNKMVAYQRKLKSAKDRAAAKKAKKDARLARRRVIEKFCQPVSAIDVEHRG